MTSRVSNLTIAFMNKRQAIELFGGTAKLARVLGISSQAVSLWADGELPLRRQNEIIGAAVRLGLWDHVNQAPAHHRQDRLNNNCASTGTAND